MFIMTSDSPRAHLQLFCLTGDGPQGQDVNFLCGNYRSMLSLYTEGQVADAGGPKPSSSTRASRLLSKGGELWCFLA